MILPLAEEGRTRQHFKRDPWETDHILVGQKKKKKRTQLEKKKKEAISKLSGKEGRNERV